MIHISLMFFQARTNSSLCLSFQLPIHRWMGGFMSFLQSMTGSLKSLKVWLLDILQKREECFLSLASSHCLNLAAIFKGCGMGTASSPKCDFPGLDTDWTKLLFTAKFACVQLKPDNLGSQLSQSSLTCFILLGHIKEQSKTKKSKWNKTIKQNPTTQAKPTSHLTTPYYLKRIGLSW